MSARRIVKRELRVAFSPRAQPVWFRVVKWIVILSVIRMLWRSPYFWFWILGGLALGLTIHFIWRWKTKAWTQPWGGWNDLDAGRDL
jgi:hypothetical protein